MSNCLLSMLLEPQCMDVTLYMTRVSLIGAASSNIICRSWIHVLPLLPLAISYTSTRAALANTVSEIVWGIHLESWVLSPSAPYLSFLFPQQVQAILNSLLWLCHGLLEGKGVLLLYWYFLVRTCLCLIKHVVWFDCLPFRLACFFMGHGLS